MESQSYPSSSPSPFDKVSYESQNEEKQEIRLHGLGVKHTTPALITFFSQMATVHGVLLHPSSDGKQWAQIWVRGEEEAERCMEARAQLGVSGVTMTRFHPPHSISTSHTPIPPRFVTPAISTSSPFSPTQDHHMISQPTYSRVQSHMTLDLSLHRSSPVTVGFGNRQLLGPLTPSFTGMGYRDNGASLPRNLYIVDLPLDMTEHQFRALFERHGAVEHCKLLSQLDGMGRRRGFILMASHREAVEAMRNMNGLVLENARMDVSWALVQREARHFGQGLGAMPNRVVHPPLHPLRREVMPVMGNDNALLLEGLDPLFFPSANTISELFSTFGPMKQSSILSSHADIGLTALIQFEHVSSADLLVQASGMILGSKRIYVRRVSLPPPPPQVQYHPQQCQDDLPKWIAGAPPTPHSTHRSIQSQLTFDPFSIIPQDYSIDLQSATEQLAQSRLNATSSPFVPFFAKSLTQPQDPISIRSEGQQVSQETYHIPELGFKTPSPRRPIKLESATPSVCHSSDTIVSNSPSSGRTQSDPPKDESGVVDEGKAVVSPSPSPGFIGSGKGVTSRMHDRWLKAGMGQSQGDDKWFKTSALSDTTELRYDIRLPNSLPLPIPLLTSIPPFPHFTKRTTQLCPAPSCA